MHQLYYDIFFILLTSTVFSTKEDANSSTRSYVSQNQSENIKNQTHINFEQIEAGDRIVGGSVADYGVYPFYARVFFNGFTCGGVIVAATQILTAAHCVYDDKNSKWPHPSEILIRTGDFTRDKDDEEATSQEDVVQSFLYFEEYNGYVAYGYDVVVLIPSKPIIFDEFRKPFQPLCRDNEPDKRGSRPLKAIGLGIVNSATGRQAEKLKEVTVDEISAEICRDYFGHLAPNGSEICLDQGGNRDTCGGDSGGPLFQMDYRNGRPYCLYGLTSYAAAGVACGTPNSPTVHSRLSYYYPLIFTQAQRSANNQYKINPHPFLVVAASYVLCQWKPN